MTLDGTNTWVLRAAPGAPAVVIDPGPADPGHFAAITADGPIGSVLITHAHPDHVEGLADFLEHSGAQLNGDHHGLAITALETPGHTADSVCFVIEHAGERVIATGDTILGRGTTVVAWPDGDLSDYLRSLRELAAYEGVVALTGHGPALADCAVAARFYLRHRAARLDQVVEVLAAGVTGADAIVDALYADLEPQLRPAAQWSVQSMLAYLERERP